MDTCPSCGAALSVGEWPFCPHGRPTYRVDAYSSPVFDMSLGREVSSSSERARIARSMNLVEKNGPADTQKKRDDIRDRQMAKRRSA